MLRGEIVLYEAYNWDFDKIKQFCDLNDIQIYRSDRLTCVVLAKSKKMYKLMKFVRKLGRKVISIELED